MAQYDRAFRQPSRSLETRYDRRYNCRDRPDSAPAMVVIDSRQRDNADKTEPSKYSVVLKKPYNDIVAAELIQFYGYNTNYNIDTGYDRIHMLVDIGGNAPAIDDASGNPILTGGDEIILDRGFYTLTDTALNDIKDVLDTAISGQYSSLSTPPFQFSILQDPATGCLIFSSNYAFSFYFNGGLRYPETVETWAQRRLYREGTIGQMLGFRPANYKSEYDTATGSWSIRSDYPANMELDRYVTMHILGFERCDSNNDHVQSAFAVIPLMAGDPGTFSMLQSLNCIDSESYIHYFPEPRKVHKLQIEFRDFNGELYDFQGRSHVFTLKLYSRAFNDKAK
jgi:hypothetical protein